jgi:hypothetical protein
MRLVNSGPVRSQKVHNFPVVFCVFLIFIDPIWSLFYNKENRRSYERKKGAETHETASESGGGTQAI